MPGPNMAVPVHIRHGRTLNPGPIPLTLSLTLTLTLTLALTLTPTTGAYATIGVVVRPAPLLDGRVPRYHTQYLLYTYSYLSTYSTPS